MTPESTAFDDNGQVIGVTEFAYPRDVAEVSAPDFDRHEIWRAALEFQNNIRRWSRTTKAANIRLDAAEYLICGKPYPADIARRHRVSERRVLQAVREVKNYIGILALHFTVRAFANADPRDFEPLSFISSAVYMENVFLTAEKARQAAHKAYLVWGPVNRIVCFF